MKLMIDIPRKVNEHIRSNYGHGIYSGYNDEDRNIIANAIYHGTPIPENATNGDMINALFPNLGINSPLKCNDTNWWNAPYKRGETK